MGQANSGFGISLDQTIVIPGDELSGFIWLDIPIGMKGPVSLSLKLVGCEQCVCSIQNGMIHGDRHTSSPNVAFEANEFLNYSYPLQQDEGELILPGSQKFPFCMILPRGLPPSITATLNDCNGGECAISYYVEAEFTEANGTCLKHEVAEFSVRNSGH